MAALARFLAGAFAFASVRQMCNEVSEEYGEEVQQNRVLFEAR